MKRLLTLFLVMVACGWASGLRAQENVPDVPILSGGLGFIGSNTAGSPTFQPILVPVIVAPFGEHWVIESRGEIQGFFFRQDGDTGPYNGIFAASLDYLQVDYIANSHLTITAGRFLTPFNIYNERLSPIWFVNLLDSPIIYPIGTRTSASSNGGMIRGVAIDHKNWNLSYNAYFSASTTTENLQSGRAAGGRVGLFIPGAGFEIGASYQRFLQNGDYNASGMYFSWTPQQIPWDTRFEYAHSPGGHGYWLESTYRLAKTRDMSTFLSRLQIVGRMQQFFHGTPTPEDFLPTANVNQFDVGLNYYLPHDVRLNGSYGRQFSSQGNGNIWNFEISYRFLFPAWPGGGSK